MELEYTAQDVAALINESATADDALSTAIERAGNALTTAAIATHVAMNEGIKAAEIVALLASGNKDTVARLREVGRFLCLEPNYKGPNTVTPADMGSISLAHYVRSVVIKLIKSGAGLPNVRAAIVGAADQRDAMAALKALSDGATVTPADEGDGEGAGEGDEMSDFARACAAAAQMVARAIDCAPLAVTEEDRQSVAAIADALAILANRVAVVTESVDA